MRGALAPHWQAHAVTAAAQAADVLEALEGHALLAAQVAFEGEGLGGTPQFLYVGVAEVLDPGVRVDPGFAQDLLGTGKTDAIHISEGNLNALFARDIYAGNPSHGGNQ